MTTNEIRQKYLNFFVSSSRNHKEIPAATLVLEDDPTTLFVSAGMQPLVPFLKGERKYAQGKTRLVNSQPSLRIDDIEEVGDNRHTTFFEMLGNWSLGDPASPDGIGQGGYWKKEQLAWCWEFFTKVLALSKDRLYVTVFEGDSSVSKDEESKLIWKSLEIPEEHIFEYGAEKNWWSRSGAPETMAVGDIGGPDSEIFYDFGTPHDPKYGKECHPNCDCGRFLEIGNSVFIQYKKEQDRTLSELSQKSVDFGGGLERIAAAKGNIPDVFATDLYNPLIKKIEELSGKKYQEESVKKAMRIIADHIKAASFLITAGVEPSNKLHGYVLRRLLRRAAVKMKLLGGDPITGFEKLSGVVVNDIYENLEWFHKPTLKEIDLGQHISVIKKEITKFNQTLERGLKEINEASKIDGLKAFNLYQTYGFPLELTQEILEEKGQKFSEEDKEAFKKEFEKHKKLSRTSSAGMFRGGLAEQTAETTKLHTATHLLHQALREVLGTHVKQMGSNITNARLRFDFSHDKKLTPEEIKKVEDLVNQKIQEGLPVLFYETTLDEAIKDGALANFKDRYGKKVIVYQIGNFSKEVCGGPHLKNTKEIGRVTIYKEEGGGSGIRRIYGKIN